MWFCPSSHQHFVSVYNVCMCNCVCDGDRESACVCACLSLRLCTCTHKLLWAWACYCNPACVCVDQNHASFCTKEYDQCNILQQPMRREPLLLGSYVFIPPVLSWGRCHASSLIDSQISMSLYDTPGSCGCDEHQHSHWFCRSTSIELRVQASSTHVLACTAFTHRAKVI